MIDITAENTSSPRPFVEVLGLWLKVLKMDEAFFAQEGLRASAANTLYAVLIYTIFTAVVTFVQDLSVSPAQFERLAPDFPWVRILQFLPLASLIFVPVGFYLGIGLMHLVARLFKGTGSFTVLAYLVVLFYVPLGMVMGLANFVPCLGGLIALGIGVYECVLEVRVFKAAYTLTTGKALASLFIPGLVILIILIPVCLIVATTVMGPGMYQIFQNVMQNQGIGTPAP